MFSLLVKLNQFLWNGPILILLCTCHLYFTLRSRFVQRHLGSAFHTLFKKNSTSAFRALSTTLAATLGTGNIIGMSTAIALGGPGAVFWCWITGIFGMATTYVECNLSLQYRNKENGSYGPMYLLKHVAHKPVAAVLFALALLLGSTCTSALTQSNALASSVIALSNSESQDVVALLAGVTAALLLAFLFFGKLLGIKEVCTFLVPAMSLFFLLGIALLLLMHITYLPASIATILKGAFGFRQMTGGFLGYTLGSAIRQGVAKGLFTNEAGLGTAPIAALTNDDTTPVEQALVSMAATFFDTVLLCGITGITLVSCILAGPEAYVGVPEGSYLIVAFSSLPFLGDAMLHISIITFAFATLLGWSFFGEKAAAYLAGDTGVTCYRLGYLLMIVFGACMDTGFVWEWADFANTFLLLPNLYLLFLLRKHPTYPSH